MDDLFNVESFLSTLRETKPPWECPKCQKVYKSFCGIEYHLLNFDHTLQTPNQKPYVQLQKKSKLKFSKKKKNSRLFKRSPSPVEFKSTTRDTLTWAEAQKMVEVESEGKIYRLNISDKLDIISDSDVDKDDEPSDISSNKTSTPAKNKQKETEDKDVKQTTSISSKDLKSVSLSMPQYINENNNAQNITSKSTPTKLPKPTFRILGENDKETHDAPDRGSAYYRYIEKPVEDLEEEVEYDMDEEDTVWLELMNEQRKGDGLTSISHDQLELLMDRFEKESYFEQAKNGSYGHGNQALIDEDAVCCVCNDGECQNSNVILFCDMCNLAVHQECYGVPYIPEGQWLCRRCLQSPSCPVDCCLCPSRSGAFKQTDDGRWSHVVCALWVPEVGFANTVFLEPIDCLKRIPSARWKLTCYICKQRNVGACIQCHKANCYTAFHVTCAQHAGLYMKMEPVRESGRNGMTVTVKKEAYCDAHTPVNASPKQGRLNGSLKFSSDEKKGDKMKRARKILAEKRLEVPHIAIPYIPRDKISSIGRHITIQKKGAFMQRLLSYWTLKRQSRNGVPLLRRLQSHVHSHKPRDPEMESQQHVLMEELKYWHRLRHDLERARLLIELIRKREKLKRETVKISQAASELRLYPFIVLLRRVVNKLQDIDVAKVFAEPVTAKEAPDYFRVIKSPMDFSTMRKKVEGHLYKNFDEFESDFNLVVDNCMLYNTRDTIFYRLAVKMRDQGGAVLRSARRDLERSGINYETGMLQEKTPLKISSPSLVDDETRLQLPLQDQLDILLERLDQAILNSKKTRKIKTEITAIRRRIFQQSKGKFGSSTDRKHPYKNDATSQRRFSADDAEDGSGNMEHEAVVSDVGSGGKISPKIRPFSLKNSGGRGRKRLWSAKPSALKTEPKIKKTCISRSKSCPNAEESDDMGLTNGRLQKSDSPNLENNSKSDDDPTTVLQPPSQNCSSHNSPASSNGNVSRRTAVLFKKKPRVSSNPQSPDISNPSTPKPDKLLKRTHSAMDSPAKQQNSGLKSNTENVEKPAMNGFHVNEIEDDCAFESKLTTQRRSFLDYREEVDHPRTSDSDTTSSGISGNGVKKSEQRKKKSPKKRRSNSTICSPRANDHSDATSNDDNVGNDVRPGLIVSTGSLDDHIRKQSYVSTTEDELDYDESSHIEPLDLVWAKCRGYPPYPALVINPQMPRIGFCHNGVPIPVPPIDVLQVGDKRIENGNYRLYLVLFFDTKRTWQWLPRNKLELLGVDAKADQVKLGEGRRPALRKNVETAFERALFHRSRVTGEIPDSDDNQNMSESD